MMIDIGGRLELLVDDALIERMEGGAVQRLHAPTPREAVFVTDRPWEGCMGGFPTVLRDGDRNRLYYRGWQLDVAEKHELARPVTICLAESDDGIRWERPALNAFDYQGIRENNIVWMGVGDDFYGTHGFSPFIDTNPACRPDQRYKAVGAGWQHSPNGLYVMTSPDGARWALASEDTLFKGNALDSHNTVFWDEHRGEYRAYFRTWTEGIYKGVRAIATASSPDLAQWSEPRTLSFPGAPDEQLYTNNVRPYYRAPHFYLGFPARYVEREWSPAIEALPELEHRRLRAKMNPRYGTALTDTLFMSSRDGVTFRRWGEAFVRPGLRAEGNWTYGDNYLAWGMLETESDLPGGGKELSFYAVEGYWRGESTTYRRHTLRIDGFVSLNAPLAGGKMLTRPLLFQGNRLSLNLSTSAAGSLRVELQDTSGRPLPGYALDDCWDIIGDTLDYTVRWKHGLDVSRLAGQPIRLRIALHDADLYSFRFC